MQIGVFSVSDVTTDPTTNKTITEHERIEQLVQMAETAENAGLDVYAIGEHHNPPFVSSSPTTTLAYIGARTKNITLSTATTLITTNDPVKIAEDFAMLQHLTNGRADLMLGRGNTGPVYPWFGQDIRQGINLALENYHLLHRLWHEDVVDWEGNFRTPLQSFTAVPRPLNGVAPFVWHGSIRSPQTAEQAAYYGDGFFHNNIFWKSEHTLSMINFYRERFAHYHGEDAHPIVGIGAQVWMRDTAEAAVKEFRPYFDHAPVYGHSVPLEQFMADTPLTVGTPADVIERYQRYLDLYGPVSRIMFLVDHAGLPPQGVTEQIQMLGEVVAPALREYAQAKFPAEAIASPTHTHLVAQRDAQLAAEGKTYSDHYRFETGDNWTGLRAEDRD